MHHSIKLPDSLCMSVYNTMRLGLLQAYPEYLITYQIQRPEPDTSGEGATAAAAPTP